MPGAPKVSRLELAAIALVTLTFAVVQVVLADRTGVTVDEPSHLLSAHLYWQGADRLQPGDMPPLIKVVGGWVPALAGLRLLPREHPAWRSNHEWIVSQNMMARMTSAEIDRVFFRSRLPFILFPVAGCLLLWWWGRQLFGAGPGVLIAVVFCLSPDVLGHGHLFKNDLAASVTFLLFWYRCWAYWRQPSLLTATAVGIATALAICAKLSLLLLLPVGLLVILAGQWRQRHCWRTTTATFAVSAIAIYAIVMAAWQFDHGGLSPAKLEAFAGDQHAPAVAVWLGRAFGQWPLPSRLWEGVLALTLSNSNRNAVYLHGQIYPGGHPLYFLTALAVKVPVLHQVLIMAGFVSGLAIWLRRDRQALFWLAPPLLYLTLASLSSLQLGLRLILPSLIFFFLWTGAFFSLCASRRRWLPRVGAAALMLMMGWRAAVAYPNYLSHFNSWVGGSEQGLAWLTDSNLDWGQNLPDFAEWVDREGIPRIHLAYFGMDNPWAYLRDDRMSSIAPPWSDDLAQGSRYVPKPGFYAISASLLTGQHFAPKYRDYFAAFRHAKPIAQIGYSIRVYEIRP
jgi:4-amino-4-deoxy-L-arabinose transferase-like glycosyltransferase